MQQALRMIVRGPAAWALALAVAVGLLELGNAVHASHVAALATPAPQFYLVVSGSSTAIDRRTRMHLMLESASVRQTATARAGIQILVQLRLANGRRHAARYRRRDFHLLNPSGKAYSPVTGTGAGALPRSGRLRRGHSMTGALTFLVPATPATYFVVWDDGGKLIPPAVMEKIALQRTTSR